MSDDRLDLPSASNAHRRRRCTGSQNLIRELRERNLLKALPKSQDALSGELVHAAWAGAQDVVLTRGQEQTLCDIKRLEELIVADWACGLEYSLIGREQRLWLRNGLEPLASGQYDCAYIMGLEHDRALILDAKTLYGDVEPAAYNDQLRELVALFRANYPEIHHYTVAILAPNTPERMSIATYDDLEAELALRLLRLSLSEIANPSAPRTPGPWCKYCPACLQCEELKALIPQTKETLGQRIERGDFSLPEGEKGARLLEQIKTVKAVIVSLEEAYKALLSKDPNALPGWHLRNGKKVRKIEDLEKALELWSAHRLAISSFLDCTQLCVTQLEQHYGAATGIKGKRLKNQFNDIFCELITIREHAPELERDRTVEPLCP